MAILLYLLRHGQTECSRDNAFCGSIDPELTSEGIEMAQAFAAADRDTFRVRCNAQLLPPSPCVQR